MNKEKLFPALPMVCMMCMAAQQVLFATLLEITIRKSDVAITLILTCRSLCSFNTCFNFHGDCSWMNTRNPELEALGILNLRSYIII